MGWKQKVLFLGWVAAPGVFSVALSASESSLGMLLELVDGGGFRIPRLEASGIVCFQDKFIVADDTVNHLFVFDREGRLSYHIESDRFPREKAKFEDLTFDASTGTFFVVGSHQGWDYENLESLSVLLRFKLKKVEQKLTVDEASVESLPLFRSFDQIGLWKPDSMKIEGLAYDSARDHLYVGLREPVDRARVYRIDVGTLARAGRDSEPPLPIEVLSFDAGNLDGTPFCISALLWLPTHRGLLIATSTEDDMEHRFLGNRLWFYSEGRSVTLVQDTFDRGMKAEGLAVGEDQLVIAYDNDQDDTDIPSRVRLIPLQPLLEGHT